MTCLWRRLKMADPGSYTLQLCRMSQCLRFHRVNVLLGRTNGNVRLSHSRQQITLLLNSIWDTIHQLGDREKVVGALIKYSLYFSQLMVESSCKFEQTWILPDSGISDNSKPSRHLSPHCTHQGHLAKQKTCQQLQYLLSENGARMWQHSPYCACQQNPPRGRHLYKYIVSMLHVLHLHLTSVREQRVLPSFAQGRHASFMGTSRAHCPQTANHCWWATVRVMIERWVEKATEHGKCKTIIVNETLHASGKQDEYTVTTLTHLLVITLETSDAQLGSIKESHQRHGEKLWGIHVPHWTAPGG